MKKNRIDWSKVDWSKRTKDLASELGVSPGQVSDRRRRWAPETIDTRRRGRKINWDVVNWNMPNKDIIHALQVSPAIVIAKRAEAGVPAPGRWVMTTPTPIKQKIALLAAKFSYAEAARRIGVNERTFRLWAIEERTPQPDYYQKIKNA